MSDTMTDSERLTLALEALQLADGVMAYCGGDAWERECTADDRGRFATIYAKLFPPPAKLPAQKYGSYTYNQRIKCALCEGSYRGSQGVWQHQRDKHGITHSFQEFLRDGT
jgi:hypothetical protein